MLFKSQAAALVLALLSLAASAAEVARAQSPSGQTPWHEGFDGGRPSWRNAGGQGRCRVAEQRRVAADAHSGAGCEWLRLEADAAARMVFAHDIGRPSVIDELAVGVWVKSDRPGVRLVARLVLPRTVDPRTNQPLAANVEGSVYTEVGRWQELHIEGLPRLLTRQVHILRMQLGPQVDPREAYVEAVLLDVSASQGTTNLWTDDLAIEGYAVSGAPPAGPQNSAAGNADDNQGNAPLTMVRLPPVDRFAKKHTAKLVGSVLLVDNRPMFPRVVQHCGESLEVLKKIGFNAVWLRTTPTPDLLAKADRLGLWLICSPPRPATHSTMPEAMPEFGQAYDCVLAWDLGDDLVETDLEPTRQWAEQIRTADRRGNRPLICRPRVDLRGFSRPSDLLLIDRRPLGTSMELADYTTWVRRQPLLASLGTPIWTTVQTQPNGALRRQLLTLEPGQPAPLCVSPEQIRLLAYTAVAAGSRGMVFASDSPLDATDPDTRQRAMALELLNLELELMEPWAAAGSFVATAEANNPAVTGALLRTEHSRLLLPLWSARGSQCVPPQSAANALGVLAPGVPEATDAYELTPNGVRSLRRERVAGGVRIMLPEFGLTTQVLLAHDPLVIDAVNRRAAQIGRRAAELQRALAVQKLSMVQAISNQLASRVPVRGAAAWFDAARKSLQRCDAGLASGDLPSATLDAQRAGRSLRLIERAHWEAAVRGLAAPVTSPAAMSFDTLPSHWRLIDRLASSRFSQNRFEGGDFEDMDTMLRAGWRYILQATPTVQAAVDLTPQASHSGRLGLRLAVVPVDAKNPPAVVERPPILFTSPAVQVEAGQLVCIHGWVRVVSDITGSSDGLLVVDSLSGESLADRIGRTRGWRQFALYRAAPQPGPMCVTFALSGMGEAWLDDVQIELVEGP